jgi:hypothetical protein
MSVRPCGTCPATGKQQYASPSEAEKRRKEIKRLRDERLSAYRCQQCSKWHLGHRTH